MATLINTKVLIVIKTPKDDHHTWLVIAPLVNDKVVAASYTRQGCEGAIKQLLAAETQSEPVPSDHVLNDQQLIDMREYQWDEVLEIDADIWVTKPEDIDYDKMMRKITYTIPRVAVGAIMINPEGKVLMCRRPHGPENYVGKLHTFGGKVDLGETLYDAIVREMREECDIDLTTQTVNTNMLGVIEEIEHDCAYEQLGEEKQIYHWISSIWVFHMKDDYFKNLEPHKHQEMGWVDVKSLSTYDIAPSAYQSLVLAGLLEPDPSWTNTVDQSATIN